MPSPPGSSPLCPMQGETARHLRSQLGSPWSITPSSVTTSRILGLGKALPVARASAPTRRRLRCNEPCSRYSARGGDVRRLRAPELSPWYALAEFVDNSLQSYISNRDAICTAHGGLVRL